MIEKITEPLIQWYRKKSQDSPMAGIEKCLLYMDF